MARWADIEAAAPELAQRVRERFEAHRHHTLATLRKDGSPRISGTEVEIADGELLLGMMDGSLKARDLRRDPRLALHSYSEDPPGEGEGPSSWAGDAKLAGRAVEIPDPERPGEPSQRFRIDVTEVVFTRVGTPADHLVIDSWNESRGLRRIERR